MKLRSPKLQADAHGQRGLTLVELMVSLMIGLVITGAVLALYLGTALANRHLAALAQMTDDAQLAFTLLRRDIQSAGSAEPSAFVATTGTFSAPGALRPLFGCDTGFAAMQAAPGQASCGGAGAGALEVSYEATLANTAVLPSQAVAVDCLGAPLSSARVWSSNRYAVRPGPGGRNELYCGSDASAAQPLVENVEAMVLTYGIADGWVASNAATRRPVRYVRAADIADWSTVAVVAVRICLLMRSSQAVFTSEDVNTYVDCTGTTRTATDRRLFRAFHSTATIRNRAAFQ